MPPQQPSATQDVAASALECPVCFEEIGEADAAMRCCGTAGRAHYFHATCLSRWVNTCRGNWATATCPVCRGAVEVHTERLQDFLNGAGHQALDLPTRGLLEGMLQGLDKGGWASGVTSEQVAEGVGIVAGLGWGFYQGYNGEAPTTGSWVVDGFVWDNAPNSVRVATIGGWVGGAGVRLCRTVADRLK